MTVGWPRSAASANLPRELFASLRLQVFIFEPKLDCIWTGINLRRSVMGDSGRRSWRSAPVLGRSNVGKRQRYNEIRRASTFGACCARGRAHSDTVVSAVTDPLLFPAVGQSSSPWLNTVTRARGWAASLGSQENCSGATPAGSIGQSPRGVTLPSNSPLAP
jgi:hypothetical protein